MSLPQINLPLEGIVGTLSASYVVQLEGTLITDPTQDAIGTIYRWHLDLPDHLSTSLRARLNVRVLENLQEALDGKFGIPMITPWFRYDTRPLDCMWQSLRRDGPTELTEEQCKVLNRVFTGWKRSDAGAKGPDGYHELFSAQWRFE
jgi:hypothetical protein